MEAKEYGAFNHCDRKFLRHVLPCQHGQSATDFFKDVLRDGQTLYPEMINEGRGMKLAGITGCNGRITALAWDTLAERNWLVVVEARLRRLHWVLSFL
jgi:hypothetical protein